MLWRSRTPGTAGGELTLVDQLGGVLVHAHGGDGSGVAQPSSDGGDGGVLGEQPDGVGVTQVPEVQPAMGMPRFELVEAAGAQRLVPVAGEAAGCQRASGMVVAAWGGEDQFAVAALDEGTVPLEQV